MTDSTRDYDVKAVRDLLLAAFTASDLRRVFLYSPNPALRASMREFSPSDGLASMVDKTIEFCVTRDLLPELLSEVQSANPRQYARFAPSFAVAAYSPPPLPPAGTLPDPGDLPDKSRVPFPRNARFTGREEVLVSLGEGLLPRKARSPRMAEVIEGMAGIGKTELAIEFAYRYGRFFYGVYWINASPPDQLGAEIAACGKVMRLSNWPEKQPEQVARTLDAWRQGGPYLVILDNVTDVAASEKQIMELVATSGVRGSRESGLLEDGPDALQRGIRVLATTRNAEWATGLGLDVISIEVLEPDENVALLRQYLDPKRASQTELVELAQQLSQLPLAIEMAGRYLASHPELTIDAYLTEMEAAIAQPGAHERLAELGITFALSWEQVSDEAARRLFLHAGQCAPDYPIPHKLLQASVPLDEEKYERASDVLAGLGLIEVEQAKPGPVIHPLQAEYARAVPGGEEALRPVAQALVQLATEASQNEFAGLRPHVEAVAASAEAAGLPEAGMLRRSLGEQLILMADYAGALDMLRRALALLETGLGRDHLDVAATLRSLGVALRETGDMSGAGVAFERALAIDTAQSGPDHPDVSRDLNNLGCVLQEQGNLADARAAFERALVIAEQAYGPTHAEVAASVSNLGGVLHELGELDGARAAFERALVADEERLGPDHPAVAHTVNNLGSVLLDLGEWEAARAAFQRALEMDELALGERHPSVARDVNSLGLVLRAMGNLEGAQDAFERALAIYERTLGAEHPTVAMVVNNLGMVLQDAGDLAGARAAFERALAIDEKVFGADHVNTARDVGYLGQVLQSSGDYKAAQEAFERALTIDRAACEPNDPHVAARLSSLGVLLHDQGELEAAQEAFEEAVAIRRDALGDWHPALATALNNLGLVQHDLGRVKEAIGTFERARKIYDRHFGESDPLVSITATNLALAFREEGEPGETHKWLAGALDIDRAALNVGHIRLAIDENNLCVVLSEAGERREAGDAMNRALVHLEQSVDRVQPETAILANNLGGLLYGLREVEETAVPVERFVVPDTLLDACLEGTCVLFAGNGLSQAAGFPGTDELVDRLLTWAVKEKHVDERSAASLRQVVATGNLGFALDNLVSALERRERKGELVTLLHGLYSGREAEPGPVYRILSEIGFAAVLSNNYDRLIEQALGDDPRVYTPRDGESLLDAFSRRDFYLLKLRGTLERPETVTLAPVEYRDALEDNRGFAQFMSSLFVSRTLLFLGASLDEILAYFEGVRYREHGRTHYALVPVGEAGWQSKAEQLRTQYNIRTIAYRAGKPGRELALLRTLLRRVQARRDSAGVAKDRARQVRLARISLQNIGAFQELDLSLEGDWTILLGDNGVGKSTILKAVALAICGEDAREYAGRLLRYGSQSGQIVLETTAGTRYVTELRRTATGADVISTPQRPLEIEGWLVLGFPPLRGLGWQQPRGPEAGGEQRHGPDPADVLPLLPGTADPRIQSLKQWIVNLDYRALKEGESESRRLFDDFFAVIDQATEGMTLAAGQVDAKTYQVTIVTDGGAVPVDVLSQGTQSLIGWLGVVLDRMYAFYPDHVQPRQEYALVLMDEIDAHMHPEWQQILVPVLKKLFPTVQFLVTTHSPLIPISSEPQEIVRLRRHPEEREKVLVERQEVDLRRWRADQVLTSSLFDLESTIAPDMQAAMERYTELSTRETLTDQEREELERCAAMLQVRPPTPLERQESRVAFEMIEQALDEQLARIPLEERQRLIEEARVQIQENITGSRRPQ